MKLAMILVVVTLFGFAAGYAFRGYDLQATTGLRQAASACPVGSHAVVWYTAKTWSCMSD